MVISGGAKGVPSAESRGTYLPIKEAQRLGRRFIVVNL